MGNRPEGKERLAGGDSMTNTSNKEELLCDICKKYPDNNCSKCNKIKQGIEQGYAKAIDYVDEVIANWQDIEVINGSCINCIKRLSTQIAKLSHSQQDKQDRQCLNQHSSGGSADTHIPKLAKLK